jgi:unspecific monooxygenase
VFWSDGLDCWVAVRPEDVEAVLASERCLVRPPGEAVPVVLEGTSLGEVFSRLVRMIDGERHGTVRRAVEQALGQVEAATVAETSSRLAREILVEGDMDRFLTALPVATLASLCRIPDDGLPKIVACTGSIVRGIARGASAEDIASGCVAVDELRRIFGEMVDDPDAPGVVRDMRRCLTEGGEVVPDTTVANLIGFLIQSHDATAGLIGNSLVRLVRRPDVPRTRESISRLMVDVARTDPAVHNTRRYAAGAIKAGGARIEAGDTILVGLAAANLADDERSWSFGAGRHACPGQEIALTIAVEGVVAACEAGLVPESLPVGLTYRPLGNVRIPQFASMSDGKDMG